MFVVDAAAADDALRRSKPSLPNFDDAVVDAVAEVVGGCGGITQVDPPFSMDPLAFDVTGKVGVVGSRPSVGGSMSSVDMNGSLLLSITDGGLSDVVDVLRSPAPTLRKRDINRRTVRSVLASSGVSSLLRLASSFSRRTSANFRNTSFERSRNKNEV